MSTLLDELKRESATRRQDATETYRELLARADSPQPGDRQEMQEAMAVLGLSADDVQNDLFAMNKAAKLRGQIVADDDLRRMRERAAEMREEARRELRDTIMSLIDALDLPETHRLTGAVLAATAAAGTDAKGRRLHMTYANDVTGPSFVAVTEAGNAADQNERLRKELAQLAREHPLAFAGAE